MMWPAGARPEAEPEPRRRQEPRKEDAKKDPERKKYRLRLEVLWDSFTMLLVVFHMSLTSLL